MRLPWISRKRHEAEERRWVHFADVMEADIDRARDQLDKANAELAEVRRSLVHAQNECARLRVQVVAERHRQGLPASPPNDEAAP